MTETVAYIQHALKGLYAPHEIHRFTCLIMEYVCGLQPYQLLVAHDKVLPETEKQTISRIVERLKQSEPIQYVLGETSFYGLSFRVNPSVLIPRPETEELVDLICKTYTGQALRIVDIGTGSGCIAVSLARFLPGSEVVAVDISAEAIRTAAENAHINKVEVAFIQTDIRSAQQAKEQITGTFDIIVSNPPYVKESEKAGMDKNVLLYEPPEALFVADDDPFVFYRDIARWAKWKLREDGAVYFEINAQLGKETLEVLRDEGYGKLALIHDLSGKERIIKAHI